jgi:hypothetical protein
VSRSSGLLHIEASRARDSQSGLKTAGGATRMMHMTSSRRLRQDQVDDGQIDATSCVGPCYPYLYVFIVLVPRAF